MHPAFRAALTFLVFIWLPVFQKPDLLLWFYGDAEVPSSPRSTRLHSPRISWSSRVMGDASGVTIFSLVRNEGDFSRSLRSIVDLKRSLKAIPPTLPRFISLPVQLLNLFILYVSGNNVLYGGSEARFDTVVCRTGLRGLWAFYSTIPENKKALPGCTNRWPTSEAKRSSLDMSAS
ncbi:hypothetical protein BJY52DRAFT_1225605 [Lactarius psammicola]|nr:hypothetical protein BJY52DRAFT_1225605 [Lactarius psammicola]